MKAVFADTFFFLAVLNPSDPAHNGSVELSRALECPRVTTAWILTEVADAMSRRNHRAAFLDLLRFLETSPLVTIIPPSEGLFAKGIELFSKRPDKDWTLTDCISFVVMGDQGLSDALTGDQHFKQAGFNPMLI